MSGLADIGAGGWAALITAGTGFLTTAGNIYLYKQGGQQIDRLTGALQKHSELATESLNRISDLFKTAQDQMGKLIQTVRKIAEQKD